MTATLTFTLPEEAHEHELACRAGAMASVLHELQRALRNVRKYGDTTAVPGLTAEGAAALEGWLGEALLDERIPSFSELDALASAAALASSSE